MAVDRDAQYKGAASVYISYGCKPAGCAHAIGPDVNGYYSCAVLSARQVKLRLESENGCDSAFVDGQTGTLTGRGGFTPNT